MDIRRLNERLSRLLEKEGFALSGNKEELNDKLQKLVDEYGDLTIPEFIDVLIQKEKQGENVLDENLNEESNISSQDKEWINNVNNFIKQIKKLRFESVNIPYNYDDVDRIGTAFIDLQINPIDSIGSYGSKRSTLGDLHLTYTNANVTIPAAYITIHQLEAKDGAFATDCAVIDFRVPSYDDYGTYNVFEYKIRDDFARNLKKQEGFSDSKYKYYNIGPSHSGTVSFEMDSLDHPQEVKYFANLFAKGLQNALEEIPRQREQKRQEREDKFNAAKSELADLSKAKREARANKNAANTTVKQALSKSAIAKKIQALQNPTPEQLAKILAAIE